jgi:RNA-directed DNA polymerase
MAVERVAAEIKGGRCKVYDADLSSYFDTIPHGKLILAIRKRIVDGSVLALIRQWLKATIVEPDGVWRKPRGKGTPQGGVISPLLSNIYLHWFETCANIIAKGTGQHMAIVRYADDFVILAREWKEGFRQGVESAIEGRFGLVVNRDKTRCVDMKAPHESLSFLGYEFRYVYPRRVAGPRYLEYGPSRKSVKRVCKKVKELTKSTRGLIPAEKMVADINRVVDGWGRYFRCGYPSRMFGKVNWYVSRRMYLWLNGKSQRGYKLKYAENYCAELSRMGLLMLTRKRYRQ